MESDRSVLGDGDANTLSYNDRSLTASEERKAREFIAFLQSS